MSESNEFPEDEQPSKTRRKREADALQALGQQLTELPKHKLSRVPVTDLVISAIAEFKRLPNSYGARKRQLQYIGRLMRDCDFDTVTKALATIEQGSEIEADTNPANNWCNIIISKGENGIEEVLLERPQLERQKLRQLYRSHLRAGEDKQQACQQKLLKYLLQAQQEN